jgi:hypothetical protein
MTRSIYNLIRYYIETSGGLAAKVRQQFGEDNLLRGWRSGAIPQEGTTSSGVAFRFHGVGCEFTSQQATIDIDFGPDGRCDGFDAIHIWRFANANAPNETWTTDEIAAEIERLTKEGVIACPGWNPTPRFYYLSGETK